MSSRSIRVVLDCPFDRAADSVRPDADEEARPLRRSGAPCGSQPTAAGAVGKWSAVSVVRRACIDTVHDLRSAAPHGIGAGYGRTTGGGGGQQRIEIVSRAGEGQHTATGATYARFRVGCPRYGAKGACPATPSGHGPVPEQRLSTCQGRVRARFTIPARTGGVPPGVGPGARRA